MPNWQPVNFLNQLNQQSAGTNSVLNRYPQGSRAIFDSNNEYNSPPAMGKPRPLTKQEIADELLAQQRRNDYAKHGNMIHGNVDFPDASQIGENTRNNLPLPTQSGWLQIMRDVLNRYKP